MTRLLLFALLLLAAIAILARARRSPELAADEDWWEQGCRDPYCDGLARA